MTGLVLLLVLVAALLFAYVPRPAAAASGNGISVPSRWRENVDRRVRVATYNMHRARGTDGVRDLRRTGNVISGMDVVALQEVGTERWGMPQVRRLGESLDMGWLYMPTRFRWLHNDRGNGLLSVLPVNDWQTERLPRSNRRTPRNLTSARVLVDGQELWILVTHLTTRAGRTDQLKLALERLRQFSPAILLADLNTTPDDPVLSAFLQQGQAEDALGVALGADDPSHRVDWILTRGLEVVSGGVDDNIASDHPFYWVELRLR